MFIVDIISVVLLVALALLLDRLLGEPRYYHPLVGFGWLAQKIETLLNHQFSQPHSRPHLQKQIHYHRLKGLFAWGLAVVPITVCVYFLDQWIGGIYLAVICGWLAIGWKSLRQHGLAVWGALQQKDLAQARLKTSYLVSRDTSQLDESALSRATIESLLENGSDAIIAPLFWLFLLGAPGVVFYRLCNTLDAMWGYHNSRFEQFGKVTARIDDVLNLIPARVTALLYTLCGDSRQAWQAWRQQGASWYSPNAGVVMASGAGALQLKLGGTAVYHGKEKSRPELGYGHQAQAKDIKAAIDLLDRSIYLVLYMALGVALGMLIFVLIFNPEF